MVSRSGGLGDLEQVVRVLEGPGALLEHEHHDLVADLGQRLSGGVVGGVGGCLLPLDAECRQGLLEAPAALVPRQPLALPEVPRRLPLVQRGDAAAQCQDGEELLGLHQHDQRARRGGVVIHRSVSWLFRSLTVGAALSLYWSL